jgi:hypothetical protein
MKINVQEKASEYANQINRGVTPYFELQGRISRSREDFTKGYEECLKDMQSLIDSHAEMLSVLKSVNEMTNNKIN